MKKMRYAISVLLGDYINKGPDSNGVLDWVKIDGGRINIDEELLDRRLIKYRKGNNNDSNNLY
jgi:hypothetical protein